MSHLSVLGFSACATSLVGQGSMPGPVIGKINGLSSSSDTSGLLETAPFGHMRSECS